jgi:acyl-CoA synthetase (AMP-forming)/AMP-acid ligase II
MQAPPKSAHARPDEWAGVAVLGDVFRRNAEACPDKTAFIGAGGEVSFAAVNARVNRLNHALATAGLHKGDRVAILSRNRTEFFEILGAAKSGFVPVPLNWRLSAAELRSILLDCQPSVIFAEERFRPVVEQIRPELDGLVRFVALGERHESWLDYEQFVATGLDVEPAATVTARDLASIVYTSGTTGRPKGAMLTHRSLLANCREMVERGMTLTTADISLAVMPLFHVGGLWYYAFPCFAAGCTTVVLPEFSPASVLAVISRHRVTTTHVVPTMLSDLLQHDADGKMATLRLIFYAASSIPIALLRRALGALRGCDLVQGYGSTEAGVVTVFTAEDHRRALADEHESALLFSCGRSSSDPGDIRIDASGLDGEDASLGEICVRSDKVMQGYWQNEAATAAAFTEGWLRTGDLGRLDERGYLYIVDRKNDMIVTGGENVFPFEVEAALLEDPAVAEAAVFGVPDERWVQRVVAAVVPPAGKTVSADAIVGRLKGRLASYKCPKDVIFVESLPRNAVGKVLRKELRSRFSDPIRPPANTAQG